MSNQEPSKKKPVPQAKPNLMTGCNQRCFPDIGCSVIRKAPYRDYSKYMNVNKIAENEPEVKEKDAKAGPTSGVKEEKPEPKEFVYLPTPRSSDEKKLPMTRIPHDLEMIKPLKFGPIEVAHTITDLPQLEDIQPGTVDTGYLVRYKDPADFNLILEEKADYKLDVQAWEGYFDPKKGNGTNVVANNVIHFKSGLDLFRGFLYMLSRYVSHLDKYELIDNQFNFKKDDLVACVAPRQISSRKARSMFAYRGVIKGEICVPLKEAGKEDKKEFHGFLVYFLDTGETRVVQKGASFLTPLPQAFTAFPPLAVHCALYGVSPVGGQWSDLAKKEVRKFMSPDENQGGVHLSLTFHSKMEAADTDGLQPYSVELTATADDNDSSQGFCVNLSSQLVKENLALHVDQKAEERIAEKKAVHSPEEPTSSVGTKEIRGRGRGRGRTLNK